MLALLANDLGQASTLAGVQLTDYFASDDMRWLWEYRTAQIATDPTAEGWVASVVVAESGAAVGHGGFHGPPTAEGMVEIG